MDTIETGLRNASGGDPTAVLDLNLQRVRETATETRKATGYRSLRLRTPEPRFFPHRPRSMTLVDPRLVEQFRALAAGKARWPLYLWGRVGTGKTFAALCLADFTMTAAYYTAEELADFVMRHTPDEVASEWDRIASKDLAVLDEIGERQQIKDLHYMAVKRFADVRENLAERVAVYISNLPPDLLGKLYDDRVASRLLSGTVFELNGPDRRYKGW